MQLVPVGVGKKIAKGAGTAALAFGVYKLHQVKKISPPVKWAVTGVAVVGVLALWWPKKIPNVKYPSGAKHLQGIFDPRPMVEAFYNALKGWTQPYEMKYAVTRAWLNLTDPAAQALVMDDFNRTYGRMNNTTLLDWVESDEFGPFYNTQLQAVALMRAMEDHGQ